MFVQFLISCVVGCFIYWAMEGEVEQARILGAVVLGLAATWFVVWAYNRIRYGKVRITMDFR